jgi:hypothetical protein
LAAGFFAAFFFAAMIIYLLRVVILDCVRGASLTRPPGRWRFSEMVCSLDDGGRLCGNDNERQLHTGRVIPESNAHVKRRDEIPQNLNSTF